MFKGETMSICAKQSPVGHAKDDDAASLRSRPMQHHVK
jgi:hypothetical protein